MKHDLKFPWGLMPCCYESCFKPRNFLSFSKQSLVHTYTKDLLLLPLTLFLHEIKRSKAKSKVMGPFA